mgnify:FL=1|jgi:hypothetical protein|tara:strand:- start:1927 stop:2268 length:342 start_codon:yes stop_codon:yes gene_type:complete
MSEKKRLGRMRQITVGQRHKIVKLADKLGYDLIDLELRFDGVRHGYWYPIDSLASALNENGIPCSVIEMDDADCGDQYYLIYDYHRDMDFSQSAHNIRYKKVRMGRYTLNAKS